MIVDLQRGSFAKPNPMKRIAEEADAQTNEPNDSERRHDPDYAAAVGQPT